jgi:hypothetical protein
MNCSRCGDEMTEDDLVLVNKSHKNEPNKYFYHSWCKECRYIVRCAQRRARNKRLGKENRDFSCTSFSEIGKELGITKEEAKNIYKKALRKIRRYLRANPLLEVGLRDFLAPEPYIEPRPTWYTKGLRHSDPIYWIEPESDEQSAKNS